MAATLVDPAAYADHRLHETYRWLRANNPLGIARPEGFDPFWVVTKHAHIQPISRQNDLFHNADRPTTLTMKPVEERKRKITGTPNLVHSLVQIPAPASARRSCTRGRPWQALERLPGRAGLDTPPHNPPSRRLPNRPILYRRRNLGAGGKSGTIRQGQGQPRTHSRPGR